MPYFHDIDTVPGTWSDLHISASDFIARTVKLVSFDRRQNKALNATHPHPTGKQLQGKRLSGTACTDHIEIAVLMLLRIEEVHDTKGIVIPIDTEQYSVVIRNLITRKHIRRCSATRQDIALRSLFKRRLDIQKRHYRAECGFLLKAAFRNGNVHRFEHIGYLLFAPHQLLIAFGGYRDESGHIKQVFIVGNPLFDVIARLNGIGKLLVIGTGILKILDFGPVQPNSLCDLIYRLASIFPLQMNIHVHPFSCIDQCRHPSGTHNARITVSADKKEAVIHAVHHHIPGM